MIKLVASDIDGTLLEEGSNQLNPELYDVIRKLKEKDILFAAASGRPYSSIRAVFGPIEHDMIFISENGANVVCRGYEIFSAPLNKKDALDLISFARSMPDFHIVASTTGPAYLEDKDEVFHDWLINGYKMDIQIVDDILAEGVDFIKIALFRREGVAEIAPEIAAQWKERFNVVVSGDCWIDFMDYAADKGHAIQSIQNYLHISKEETMAFGDNHNDIGMMNSAGSSYAVESAKDAVKEAAKYVTDSAEDDGVLKVLKTLL